MNNKAWQVVSPIIGLLGFLYAVIALDSSKLGVWYIIILVTTILLIAIPVVVGIYNLIKNGNTLIRHINFLLGPKMHYELEEKEVIYTFLNRTEMTLEKRFKIRSKTSQLRDFYDMYMWSKDYQKCELQTINEDTITCEESEAHWQSYCIQFNEFCGKNQTHETGIIMPNLKDPEKKSKLFLSTGIFEPTKSVTLKVVINNPCHFRAGSTKCLIYNFYHGRVADHTEELIPEEFNGGQIIEYKVLYPIKNARYKLEWDFDREE